MSESDKVKECLTEIMTWMREPVGWFNPWNDYHGYQQVAKEFEGQSGTIPLYAAPPVNALSELANKIADKIIMLEQCQREHPKIIAQGRLLQAQQIQHWIGEISLALSSTVRKAPKSCPHCIDETDCASVDICNTVADSSGSNPGAIGASKEAGGIAGFATVASASNPSSTEGK